MNQLQELIAKADKLPDKELREAALAALKSATDYPYSDFLPSMDTSREGLLDLIAGLEAIAAAKVVVVQNPSEGKG